MYENSFSIRALPCHSTIQREVALPLKKEVSEEARAFSARIYLPITFLY
jgi:hypothetical protein